MLGADLLCLLGVEKMVRSVSVACLDFSSEARAQRTAFCCRLRAERRWVAPFEKTWLVILAMWAMVAFGAVSTVYVWLMRAFDGVFVGDRDATGEERLMFSIRGVFDGLSRSAVFSLVSCSARSIARRQMSKALRRSPV